MTLIGMSEVLAMDKVEDLVNRPRTIYRLRMELNVFWPSWRTFRALSTINTSTL
jgi:hypothetical protein